MLAAVKLTSATRQNLWRLTFIRILVLAAQAGSVGLAIGSICCRCRGCNWA